MPAKKKDVKANTSSTIAKSEDGTIQLTFSIPYEQIKSARETALQELATEVEVPGFRQGKAPISKVVEKIPENTLLEKTLTKVLPELLSEAINKYKIKPAIYPRFELVKAVDGEEWQVRATTCEIPEFELGDYKKKIESHLRSEKIWVPGKQEANKELSQEEKEQETLKALIKSVDIKIPKVLVEEEVNTRLSNLLERLEKLGLSLDSYLSSTGKTSESLRQEYEKQAADALALDLILTQIAKKEGIKIEKAEIDAAVNASGANAELSKELDNPERRRFIEVILKRRKALSLLMSSS